MRLPASAIEMAEQLTVNRSPADASLTSLKCVIVTLIEAEPFTKCSVGRSCPDTTSFGLWLGSSRNSDGILALVTLA